MQTYESDANIGNIKILAVDMDKTLLTDERVLPQGLDERLDKLADAGIVFCPASGRPAPKLEEMFEGIKNRLAFCPDNGACVIYRGGYIYKSNIDGAVSAGLEPCLGGSSRCPRPVLLRRVLRACPRPSIPRRDQRLLQHNQLRRQL